MTVFEVNNIDDLKNKLSEHYELLIETGRIKNKTGIKEYEFIINGLYGYINEDDCERCEEPDYFYADENITHKVLTKYEFIDNIINDYLSNKTNCKYFMIEEF